MTKLNFPRKITALASLTSTKKIGGSFIMVKNYEEFLCGGYVSIWIGNLTDEDSLDDYIRKGLPNDFGFVVSPRAVSEIDVRPKAVKIIELVDGFSRSKTFDAATEKAAQEKGIASASCMFIMYNFRYLEAEIRNKNAPLQFLGAISFPGFD